MAPRPRFENLEPEKKEKILTSASEEFSDKGFDGASFNRIIENAGISKGAAYYYFDDKTDLFDTVIDHLVKKMTDIAGGFTLDELTEENFWPRLEQYSLDAIKKMQTNQWMKRVAKMLFRWTDSDSGTSKLLINYVRRYTQTFLEKGQSLGKIRTDIPMDLLIEMLLGLGFAADRWLIDKVDDLDPEELEQTALVLVSVYKGLLSPQDTP